MKLLTEYLALQKQIYDYFGYKEDWKTIPIDDRRDAYWILDQDSHGYEGDKYAKVIWSPNLITEESIFDGEIYGGMVYTQGFRPSQVYRGIEYTMICIDPRTDGNKFLMIFDNAKEQTDQALKDCYNNNN